MSSSKYYIDKEKLKASSAILTEIIGLDNCYRLTLPDVPASDVYVFLSTHGDELLYESLPHRDAKERELLEMFFMTHDISYRKVGKNETTKLQNSGFFGDSTPEQEQAILEK